MTIRSCVQVAPSPWSMSFRAVSNSTRGQVPSGAFQQPGSRTGTRPAAGPAERYRRRGRWCRARPGSGCRRRRGMGSPDSTRKRSSTTLAREGSCPPARRWCTYRTYSPPWWASLCRRARSCPTEPGPATRPFVPVSDRGNRLQLVGIHDLQVVAQQRPNPGAVRIEAHARDFLRAREPTMMVVAEAGERQERRHSSRAPRETGPRLPSSPSPSFTWRSKAHKASIRPSRYQAAALP